MAEETRTPKLLLVEDEFLIRLTLAEALVDEGFEVLEAEEAGAALSMLEADPAIRVLLTDIQLPGAMDGRTLVQRAREKRPDLPVIFMTGRPDSMSGANTSPRDVFVAKPYLPSQICAAARRLSEMS